MAPHLLPPALSSTYDVLAKSGECYYIPAYQRSFAWDGSDIERLFEDLVQGIVTLVGEDSGSPDSDAETFIGTIVCFHDTVPFQSVYPYVDNDVPGAVYTLVDGQQRITVILMISVLLHDLLRTTNSKFGGDEEDELTRQKQKTMAELLLMLSNTEASGDRRYYPRLIRGPVDKWSVRKKYSKYTSPIGALLSQYVDFLAEQNERGLSSSFSFICDSSEDHKAFQSAYNRIKRYIKLISYDEASSTDSNFALPNIDRVFSGKGKEVLRELFSITAPMDFFADAKGRLAEVKANSDATPNKVKKARRELGLQRVVARALLLAAYMMQKVKFVRMVTKSEDYAYRIFDSLNTTGDPLTAYETFKPEVVKRFGSLEDYNLSTEKILLDEIDSFVNIRKKLQEKKTRDLVTIFALGESGQKLPRNLSDQRKYLLKEYDNSGYETDYVRYLLHVTRVNESFIRSKDSTTPIYNFLSDTEIVTGDLHQQLAGEARFCMRFLSEANHTICAPLISRFYSRAFMSRDQHHHIELCEAIRSTAAFLALWRSSRPGTDNIDNHHRNIMRAPDDKEKGEAPDDEGPYLNFRRHSEQHPDLRKLQAEYRALLERRHEKIKIANFIAWRDCALTIPIYETARYVSKFVLLLASYNPNARNGAGIQAPSDQFLFDFKLWDHSAHETIEHIKSRSSGASDSTAEKELLDSIGNLTLLPFEVNAFIGDAEWAQRKAFYYALSSRTEKEFDMRLGQLPTPIDETDAQKLKGKAQSLRERFVGRYLPFIASIAAFKQFTYADIKIRGGNVLKDAWDPLHEWLGGGFGKALEEEGD